MKHIDIMSVHRDSLVDISSVTVDESKPKNERILDFIEKIKNPYCFKCGDTVVSVQFSDTDYTFQDALVQYLKNKME
ncbi:MAG: hypothetical protein LIP16_19830 [Clostridium sp.]|nr:hypothetical protein [Clostridium sp.]